ncbi:MAG: hypothetical protein Ct9H300mP32_1550 [Verrucomicrobiota bacterium]|nr:MAG: hypothetical protein Ct9H300mP32_1550 [Verrucomicrobiota bacterium]
MGKFGKGEMGSKGKFDIARVFPPKSRTIRTSQSHNFLLLFLIMM